MSILSPWICGPTTFAKNHHSPPNILFKILLCPRHGQWMINTDVLHIDLISHIGLERLGASGKAKIK